ncbi:ATP-binding protein [Enterocloster asparagiformis]|uniref:ATP-binding protein n=1 Tax=Enterocloster asparagiformis TaxID=333367 RepID=UPI0034AC6B8E
MEIIRGKIPGAKKVVCYGPEGIGKSTFAAQFPDPLFIDTEGSTKDMDVARTPAPSSWMMLMEQVQYVKNHPDICRTLVIDTADWAEHLCIEQICDKKKINGIEDIGFGKGYTYVQEEFGRLLNLLEEVVKVGINAVITAHAKMRKFELPDELGSYDRWEMKLTKQTAPLVKEWADMVLFANYKTFVVNVDGQGAQKGKNKAQGGKRVMYTTHHSCWDAKNRYGLADEVPFEYESIRHIIEGQVKAPVAMTTKAQAFPVMQQSTTDMDQETVSKSSPEPQKEEKRSAPVAQKSEPMNQPDPVVDPRVPKKLRDLMIANGVDEWDVQAVSEAKGYVPCGTPLWEYETVNPGFTDGVLVAAWDQVYREIQKMKQESALVFN